MTTPTAETIADVCARTEASGGYRIRPWSDRDAPVLVAAWDDPEIAKWNPVPPSPSLNLARSWIEGTTSQNVASTGIDVVVVAQDPATPPRPSMVIGEIGLQVDPVQEIAEIGFWISDEYRGNGIGKPLLALARRLAVSLELQGLVALTDTRNSKAIELLQSAGWSEVPTMSERRAFAVRARPAP